MISINLSIALIIWALHFTGCISLPGSQPSPVEPFPIEQPTAQPTLPPPIPPYDIPTPDTTAFEIVSLPTVVEAGKPFLILVKAKELDSVNVIFDGKFQVGKMFWDAERGLKYLSPLVSAPGDRIVSFRVNGIVVHSQQIKVQ